MRRFSVLSLILGLAPAFACAQNARVPASTPTPSLLVFITVDQMRPDYFSRFESQLSGGLSRLYRGGAFYTNAFQDHAITETAPGHSVTMSGRFPRSTGIVRNSEGVDDPRSPVIGGGALGASPFRFRGTALIDWLQRKDPRSRALSVSRKDRGRNSSDGTSEAIGLLVYDDGEFLDEHLLRGFVADVGEAVQRSANSRAVRGKVMDAAAFPRSVLRAR